jgi:methyl-accepting chemotaxis protein
MKLETKLGMGTGGLIVAMLLSAFTAHLRIASANRLTNHLLVEGMPLVIDLEDAQWHLAMSVRALESDLLFGKHDGSSSESTRQRAEQMRLAERSLQEVLGRRGEVELESQPGLDQLKEEMGRLRSGEEQVERLNNTGATPDRATEAYLLLEQSLLPLHDEFIGTLSGIEERQNASYRRTFGDIQRANELTVITLWVATFVGAVGGGGLSMVLGRRVARAVAEVAERADCIAGGDLTQRELSLVTEDQIGMLAAAMNRMQQSLGSIIGTVAETAGSLTGSAASMRSASDQIHRRIDQQSQQTQQAATAMQEMSASIAEVSRHTQSAAETARGAAQTAREGGKIVKQMLGSMHQIASAVTETSCTVGLLGEDSKRISQIVTVIDEIARKTNLLALNAAIEAARAGDQGRGFAVVAGEVRRLAESTAQATGEIGTMIQEIQDRTRTAIASMASGTGTVQEGVVTTTQAGEALERIIGMAERVDRMITQIAIAASQQAQAADQSSASLDSIHSLSHDNLTEMATTAAGIETLRGTAVTLERQVDRFQVGPAKRGSGK